MNEAHKDIDELLGQLQSALRDQKSASDAAGRADAGVRAGAILAGIKHHFDHRGWGTAQRTIERHVADRRECAAVFLAVAKTARSNRPEVALKLGRRACALDPGPYRAKWLGFVAFDAGHISEAARLLASLPADVTMSDSEARRRMHIEGFQRMLAREPEIPPRRTLAFRPAPRTLLYVTSSCQPFHVSGYTIRTQSLLEGVAKTAWKAVNIVRPGYPWDRTDVLASTENDAVECGGVEYRLIRGLSMSLLPPDAYIAAAAAFIEKTAREVKPSVIQSASNHMTALPSLIAARRLGLPFVYEVRGLWEMSAASSKSGWEKSQRFLLSSRLEGLAARNADAVFTLTRQLSRELQERGVEASRISLLPNGGDTALFESVTLDRGLIGGLELDPAVFTIGYAGAIKYYEGLEDLLEAMALLRAAGRPVQAIIAGDGDGLPPLRAKSTALGLDPVVRFTGRLAPAAARAYLRATDAAVLPRKRLDVGETVSPLKPLEIMALETPLLMSDVAPLADIAEDSGNAAFLFEASNPSSLAGALARVMDDPALRREMASRAREFVATKRSWGHIAGTMVAALDEIDARINTLGRKMTSRATVPLLNLVRLFRKRSRQSRQVEKDVELVSRSGMLDIVWYLQRYPDVARSGLNPIEHYVRHGAAERRDPSPGFQTSAYIKSHPEVLRDGINPLVHHLRHGQQSQTR